MTVAAVLERAVERWPDNTALIFRGEKTSYRELHARASGLAWSLRQLGLQAGDRVAVMLMNSADYCTAYWGHALGGLVTVPVNVMFKEDEVHHILTDSGARVIIANEAFLPLIEALRPRCPQLEQVVVVAETAPPKTHHFEALIEQGRAALAADPGLAAFRQEVTPEHLVSILYTSGTTGKPKGAMLTHDNVAFDAEACSKALPVTHEDVWLCALPMFHSYAQTTLIVLPMLLGSSVVIVERFIPDTTMRLIEQYRATVFPGVPAMYATFLSVPPENRASLASLKWCISGGAPMPSEVMRAFEKEFDLVVLEGDGPTECSPVTSVNPHDGTRKPLSVGFPLPGVEIKIFDEKDNELPQEEVGEIVVRGRNVMKGYWNRPEETAKVMASGWLHTGDLGKIDAEGYVYIVDRKKDMVLVGGLNVYPREVEEVICSHPAVAMAAVVGVADRLRGEAVKAFVVIKPGAQATESEIRAYCRQKLAVFKVPRQIEFRDSLPISNTGKVLKRVLRGESE